MNKISNYTDKDFIDALIEASNKNKLILFLGAGYSRLFKIKARNSLANDLIYECVKNPKCEFNYFDEERLHNKISDPREKISIAYNNFLKIDPTGNEFVRRMKYHLEFDKDSDYKIYNSILFSLSNIIFSTNADLLVDDTFKGKVKFKENDLKKLKVLKNELVHFHGKIPNEDDSDFNDAKNSLIFTAPQYLKRYTDKDFRKSFSKIIEQEYVFLFIGYGLTEYQFLDFLLNANTSKKFNAYVLKPYFKNDKKLMEDETNFFKDYGIKVVSYYLDNKGYDSLKDVLEYLKEAVYFKSKKYSDDLKMASELLEKEPTPDRKDKFLKLFVNFEETKKYEILREIHSSKYLSSWVLYFLITDETLKYFKWDIRKRKYLSYFFDNLNFLVKVYVNNKLPNPLKEKIILLIKNNLKDVIKYDPQFNKSFVVDLYSKREILEDIDFLNLFYKLFSKIKNQFLDVFNKSKVLFLINDFYKLEYLKTIIDEFNKQKFADHTVNEFINIHSAIINKNNGYHWFLSLHFILTRSRTKSAINEYLDSFDSYLKDKDFNRKPYFVNIKFLVLSLNALKDDFEQTKNIYNLLITLKDNFSKKIIIYIFNLDFKNYKKYFIEYLNEFNNPYFYNEIYSLIENNLKLITDNELSVLLTFIKNISIFKNNEIINIEAKLEFINILLKHFSNNSHLNTLKKDLLNKKESYGQIKVKINLNNFIDSWSKNENLKIEYAEKIKKMTFDEFSKEYNLTLPYEQYKTLKENCSLVFEKNNIIKNINEIDFINLNEGLLIELIKFVLSKKPKIEVSLTLLNKLIGRIKEGLSLDILVYYSMYYQEYRLNDIYKNESELIFDSLINYLKEDKINYLPELIFKDNCLLNIEQSPLFNYINFLYYLLDEVTDKNKIFDYFDKAIYCKNKVIIKCSIVQYISILYKLNKNWVLDNLEVIFNNEFHEVNASVKMYLTSYSYISDVEFNLRLVQLDLIEEFIKGDKPYILGYMLNALYFNKNISNYSKYMNELKCCSYFDYLVLISLTMNEKAFINNAKEYYKFMDYFLPLLNKENTMLITHLFNYIYKIPEALNKNIEYIAKLSSFGFEADELYSFKESVASNKYLNNNFKLTIFRSLLKNLKNYRNYHEDTIIKILDQLSYEKDDKKLYLDKKDEIISILVDKKYPLSIIKRIDKRFCNVFK